MENNKITNRIDLIQDVSEYFTKQLNNADMNIVECMATITTITSVMLHSISNAFDMDIEKINDTYIKGFKELNGYIAKENLSEQIKSNQVPS